MAYSRRAYWILAVALLIAGLFRLLWPQDTTFLVDQAMLFEKALHDNASHVWTTFGLRGTRGLDYGPFAIWLYRALLHVTHNLVAVILLRIILVTATTVLALLWLARLCGFLMPAVAVIPLLSPYLWYYARDPWDNTLMIPFVALALASYLAFHRQRKTWQLGITVFSLAACFLTHLMCLPLILAIALHFLIFHRDWPRRHRLAATMLTMLVIGMTTPYLIHLSQLPHSSAPAGGRLASLGFSLCGAVQLSAIGFERFLGKGWFMAPSEPPGLRWISTISTFATAAVFIFCWYGLFLTIRYAWQNRRHARIEDLRFHLCWLATFGFLFFLAVCLRMRLFSYPHYYNGVWIFFFVFLWVAITEASKYRWARIAAASYAGCLMLSLTHIAWIIHTNGGSRELSYGPTLGNLVEVAKRLNAYGSEASYTTDVFHLKLFPNMLTTLRELYPPTERLSGQSPVARISPLVIRYVSPENRRDGRIEVSPPVPPEVTNKGIGNGIRSAAGMPWHRPMDPVSVRSDGSR